MARIDGIDYKVGVHGFVFYKAMCGEWKRTGKTQAQLSAAIETVAQRRELMSKKNDWYYVGAGK